MIQSYSLDGVKKKSIEKSGGDLLESSCLEESVRGRITVHGPDKNRLTVCDLD